MGAALGSLALNPRVQVPALSGPKPRNQSPSQGLGEGKGIMRGKRTGNGA